MLLPDGFRTLVTFSLRPGIFLREREVTPPELDGGAPIDTTTMRNLRWRTQASRSLLTLGELVLQCQYDPFVYAQLIADMQVNQLITVTFPDGALLAFYGWINKFTPPSHKEGEFPVAEVRIVPRLRGAAVAPQVIGGEVAPTVQGGIAAGFVVL